MSEIILLSSVALQASLTGALLPTFKGSVAVTFGSSHELGARLSRGEPFDIVIATDGFLTEQAMSNVVTSPVPLVSGAISIAAALGAGHPPIDSIEALKSTLIGARSVAYSQSGASGLYFAQLLRQLGIADDVNARATILPSGLAGEALLDGRADLAVQQTSELLAVSDIQLLGPLPAEVQQTTRFAVALRAEALPQSAELCRHLTSPFAAGIYASRGLEPLFAVTE